ncbi:CLUMA_CG005752, isoform A [Clunio marinus]|uniref:CLUMA_CG005752, isoform A n=1 Tax=Clunio marinus TaxID=568069 RepID=A0A1J1HW31_9DIPT|nr:CLUMA_CG005752, isoform A [Clunio marinus]
MNSVRVFGQSNYASHGNNINYIGNGLPEETVLDGKVTKLDDLSPIIFLNRTKAALNCGAGSMEVDMKFNEKFYGVAYADFDRNSACQIIGKGDLSYKIELPLKGCGTKQDPQRVFTNNIVVRFHPGLEMDGDEIITIVCRYPPPIAPVPAPLPIAPVGPDPRLAEIITAPLRGTQILFIICALMFLTLLLLGLGVSYYCLRRRTIPVVRRLPMYMGSGSEITKLSGSSLGNLSVFEEGLKIPRAHVPVLQAVQSSSDTLPSDYPSESHSEIEEVDTRSLPHSSVSSYENHAYLQEASSVYSENLGQIQVQEIQAVAVTKAPSPKFDVQVRVKRPPPPPPSISSSSETESAASRAERNNLSTIMESHEDRESILTVESLPHEIVQKQFTYMPEIHPAPKYDAHPLGYSTLNKNAKQYDSLEPPIHVIRKPEITSAVVDDVFLRTITEKRTIEDIEKQKRMVTEYKVRPMISDPTWDVKIRNLAESGGPQWEDFSDISSASGIAPPTSRAPMNVPPTSFISETGSLLRSPEMVGNMKPIEMPEEDKAVPNWDVLIRVLEEPAIEPVVQNRYETSTNILHRQLSYEDRVKWKEIITTESTLRKMLTEAVVREDFERISRDVRYEQIFEPQSWEVIIRILAPPDDDVKLREPKSNKKQPWDTRSRRSSLPTLYEYDSDGGSSVRTIKQDLIVSQQQPGPSHAYLPHSRRTSRSSYRSGSDFVDMRSMAETTVDFTRPESYFEKASEGSSYQPRYYDDDRYSDHRSLHRSVSHPSLARSESEFMEQWVAPIDGMSSPEGSPRMRRTQRVLTTFQPRPTNASVSGSAQRVVTSETQYSEQRTMKYQTGDSSQWYSKHQ